MQTVERHGGGSHFVRPDRVYRTGVLTSTMGYDPGADVQSVAASFTQYPMDLSLSGLRGLGGIGFLDRIRMRFAAWKARRQLSNFGQQMSAMAHARNEAAAVERGGRFEILPGGTYAQVGIDQSPQLIAKESMVEFLTRGREALPNEWAQAKAQASLRRWSSPWYRD
jgi:hypothetical protein